MTDAIPNSAKTHFEHLVGDNVTQAWSKLRDAVAAFDRGEARRDSGYAARLSNLYLSNFGHRARAIVAVVREVQTVFDLPDSEEIERSWSNSAVEIIRTEQQTLHAAYVRALGRFGLLPHQNNEWANQLALAHASVLNGISRFFWNLRNVPKKPESKSQTINFHGAVGAVQVGNDNTAHISQNLTVEGRQSAANAIASFMAEVQDFRDLPMASKDALISDSKELHQELERETPTFSKVLRWADRIGSTIQTVSALNPAWETVKTVLRMAGVPV